MARIIAILSGKGGVGKTTSAINIASSLTLFGRANIIIDADISSPNLSMHIGNPKVTITFNDVLAGKKKIKESIYLHSSGLKVVLSSVYYSQAQQTSYTHIKPALEDLKDTNEIVIIDGPPGNGNSATSVIRAVDEILIVTNPELPAVTDALRTIKIAEDHKKKVIGVVVTRVRKSDMEMLEHNISTMLGKPIIGVIPEDDAMKEALLVKNPVSFSHPDSPSAIAYKKLAARIIGEEYEPNLRGKDTKFTNMMRKIGLR